MKRILAIIPARGGSKGVHRKNIKELNNKPLISWTINAARKSKYIDKVIVSTEDEEIASTSRKYGAEVPFLRPNNLAEDDTPSIDPIMHAIQYMKNNHNYCPDYVMLLQCTSPLRSEYHIDEAIELLLSNENADALISVTEIEHPPQWNKIINKHGYLQDFIEYDKTKLVRRQDFEKVYRLNGAIYIAKTDILLEKKDFESSRTISYIMDRKSSMDIDTIEDFQLTEFYMKKNNYY